MYIYNVTVHVESDIQKEWLAWMRETHIPEMIATGKFTQARIFRVMVADEEGATYSIQYTTNNKETLQKYYAEDADSLRQSAINRFAGKFVAFRTELEVIHTHETISTLWKN